MEILIYSVICVALITGIFLYFEHRRQEKRKKEERDEKIKQFIRGGRDMYHKSNVTFPVHRPKKSNQVESRVESPSTSSSSDDGFVTSMLVAQATDSAMLGTIIGGNPLGAMIGDSLNDNDTKPKNLEIFDSTDYSSPSDSSSYDSGSSYDSSSSFDSSDSSSSSW